MWRRCVTSRHIGRRSIRDRFKSECLQTRAREAPEVLLYIRTIRNTYVYTSERHFFSSKWNTTLDSATSRARNALPFLLLRAWHRVTSSPRSTWHVEPSVSLGVTRRRRKKLSFLPGSLSAERGRQERFFCRVNRLEKPYATLRLPVSECDRVIDRLGDLFKRKKKKKNNKKKELAALQPLSSNVR